MQRRHTAMEYGKCSYCAVRVPKLKAASVAEGAGVERPK